MRHRTGLAVGLLVLALVGAWGRPAGATPPRTPIELELSLSGLPLVNDWTTATITVTSLLDAPGTTVELVLPQGLSAPVSSWQVDLVANVPVILTAPVFVGETGNLTIAARALKAIGPTTVWGDMKSIPLHVGGAASGPSLAAWKIDVVPVGDAVTPGTASVVSDLPTRFAFTPAPRSVVSEPSIEPLIPGTPGPPSAPAAPGMVTLTGRWRYHDRSGVERDIDQQLIEIRKGDGTALNPRVFCFTDGTGRYSCSAAHPGTTMRVWVRSWASFAIPGGANRLGVFSGNELPCGSDSVDCTYAVQTAAVSCADGAECDLGTLVVATSVGEPWLGAHQMTQDLIRSWKKLFFDVRHPAGTVAGPGRINYPVPAGHGTHAHVRGLVDGWMSIEPPNQQSADIVLHEYGHVVMSNLWAGAGFSPSFPTGDCPSPHFINVVSGPGCALSEGWANFWAWYSNELYDGDNSTANDGPVFNFPGGGATNLETRDNGTFQAGDQVEGNIAAVLGDILDSANDGAGSPADRLNDGVQHIWHTMLAGSSANFAEWWADYQAGGHDPCPVLDIIRFNSIPYALLPQCSAASARIRDFNGDGRSDILWRHDNGSVAMWLMNGGAVAGSSVLGVVGNNWDIAGIGDFNGGGRADILWRNSAGDLALWFMNGPVVAGSTGVGSVDPAWRIAGVADFNGDGRADILWRHVSGAVFVWLMNGATVVGSAHLGSIATSWTIAGLGDFNGDGKADILWRDTAGTLALWFLNGTSIAGSSLLGNVSTAWRIAGLGDFNGDGRSDILWRHNNGSVALWLMNGASVIGNIGVGAVASSWVVDKIADFNGDGKADLLWRQNAGAVGNLAMWLMNGGAVAGSINLGQIANVWVTEVGGAP